MAVSRGQSKIVVADGDAEVLGDLAAAEHGADRLADGGSARERLASAADAGLDALQVPLGGGEQFASLARAFLGQRRVAADDEALARIVRAFDLGQIALVEQRELQRAAVGRERPDGRRPERGDPVEPGRWSSSSMRALVIRPRSPTSTTRFNPKRSLILAI